VRAFDEVGLEQGDAARGHRDVAGRADAALEVRVREFLQHTQVVAHELSPLSDFELIGTLDRERRESTALEFTVVGAQTRIIATLSLIHIFAFVRSLDTTYGRRPAGILPACRQRLGRIARFCRLPRHLRDRIGH